MRMVGVRDIALGVGAITNLKEEKEDAEWVSMGALADGGDAIALVLAPIGWRRVANGTVRGHRRSYRTDVFPPARRPARRERARCDRSSIHSDVGSVVRA